MRFSDSGEFDSDEAECDGINSDEDGFDEIDSDEAGFDEINSDAAGSDPVRDRVSSGGGYAAFPGGFFCPFL